MSSLQCAARLFVARHGEAEYETEFCSDHGGSLTALGRRQARELADRLRGDRSRRRDPRDHPPAGGSARGHGLGSVLPNCGVVELEADADGWRLAAWDRH
jgi:hypothetical protein